MNEAPQIVFDGVSKEYPRSRSEGPTDAASGPTLTVMSNLDLSIRVGEFVALLGPSGCGKSTLLNLLAGLTVPTAGTVYFKGVPVEGVNTQVGYVTQQDSLLPWRSVAFNIELPLRVRGVDVDERLERTRDIINSVGLDGFEQALPNALSGGMRSRVMIARTFIYEPEVLLLDEPFAALDALMRLGMQEELLNLWLRTSATVLYVTHDIDEALSLADRVLLFSRTPTEIVAEYQLTDERPRHVRKNPEYGALYEEIWGRLKPEIM